MSTAKKSLRVCSKGHEYYKSSSCPVCPVCEKKKIPDERFLAAIAAPARRALEHAGIFKLNQLAKLSEAELLALHGMGPGSLPKLRSALAAKGLSFKKR